MITLVLSQSESFCLSYTLQKWFFKFKESLMIHTEGQKKPYTSFVMYSKWGFFVQCCCFFVNWSRPFCLYIIWQTYEDNCNSFVLINPVMQNSANEKRAAPIMMKKWNILKRYDTHKCTHAHKPSAKPKQ